MKYDDNLLPLLAKLAMLAKSIDADKLPRNHPIIMAMCDAAYG
jgi:hypothetical protein